MANVNGFLENLGRTFEKTADKVVKKTDELISVQKVKSRKNSLENQMDAAYRSIGKIVFQEYAKGSPVSEEIAKYCEKIKKLQKQIDICVSEIADIKGEKVCDTCGNPIPEDADFCMKCGNPKPDKDEVEDADFQEAEAEEAETEDAEEEADADAEQETDEANESEPEDTAEDAGNAAEDNRPGTEEVPEDEKEE